MTDIVSISRININLIESPFILMNALREYNYNASGRQRTQPGDFETEFTNPAKCLVFMLIFAKFTAELTEA